MGEASIEEMERRFFSFIYERQLIWHKRFVLKQQAPWTDDEVMRKYKIINMYRELDRCTLYLLSKLKDIQDRRSMLLNVIFYRFFNRSGLYEELKMQPFGNIDKDMAKRLKDRLDSLKAAGKPIFNNAYLISSGTKGSRKHHTIIDNLSNLDIADLIESIDSSKTPEESLQAIMQIPMIGPFLACEIWTDLSYLKFFKQSWTDDDFVNIGPGAAWGLELMYGNGKHLSKSEQYEKLNRLHSIQNEYLDSISSSKTLKWKDIAYKGAYSNYPYLSITNIEGALCEFRKYLNLSNGKGKRRYFTPCTKES